jgi:hypothetical protein
VLLMEVDEELDAVAAVYGDDVVENESCRVFGVGVGPQLWPSRWLSQQSSSVSGRTGSWWHKLPLNLYVVGQVFLNKNPDVSLDLTQPLADLGRFVSVRRI